jgi:hypothetical protein
MSATLRLSDVLGRTLAIEWFEAVAIVRAVSEVVTAEYDGIGVPDLDQVELTADGEISISGATETKEPVRRLGQLLQAVLTQSAPPVQLRLIVAQATAPVPSFGSSEEFSDALGYFERPDRTGVLRRFHARALSASEPALEISPTIDMIAPLETDQAPASKKTRRTLRPSRRSVLAVLVGAVVVAIGAAYWKVGADAVSPRMTAIALRASGAVGGAMVSGVSKVTEKIGLGRLAPADPAGSNPPAPLPAAAPLKTGTGTRRNVRPAATTEHPSPLQVFDLDAAAAADAPPPPSPEAVSAPPVAGTAVPEQPVPDEGVYSAADTGVAAPIGIRPHLPHALPPNINKDQLGQIELLILPDGTVASVRLLGPHRGVLEGMLLSAAKAWTFQPAIRNGRPVMYRKVVWLVVQ